MVTLAVDHQLIEAAAEVLSCRAYADTSEDDRWDDELLTELALVALATPHADTADLLADHWIAERQDAYERSIPTWTCDCGTEFKVIPRWPQDQEFHRVTDDGLVGEFAGEIRLNSKGRLNHTSDCPVCGKTFHDTITRQAQPQMSLF